MPDIAILAKKRAHVLDAVQENLGITTGVPGTKADPVVKELFMAETLAALAQELQALRDRVATLESKAAKK
jgi:hypothetical protein